MKTEIEKFYYETFFEKIKGPARTKPDNSLLYVQSLFGKPLPKELETWLDFLDRYELNSPNGFIGEICVWDDGYMMPSKFMDKNSFDELLKESVNLFTPFANAIPLGADFSGNVFFAHINNTAHTEIYMEDHDTGQMKFLADSIPAFFYLNNLADEVTQYKKIHENIPSDLIEILKEKMVLLKEKVNLIKDEITTEFDNLLPTVTGITPNAKPISPCLYLLEKSDWLIGFFEHKRIFHDYREELTNLDAFKNDMSNVLLKDLPAVKVYWLWCFYFFDYQKELNQLLQESKKDNSKLVQDTALLIEEIINGRKVIGIFHDIPQLKRQLRSLIINRELPIEVVSPYNYTTENLASLLIEEVINKHKVIGVINNIHELKKQLPYLITNKDLPTEFLYPDKYSIEDLTSCINRNIKDDNVIHKLIEELKIRKHTDGMIWKNIAVGFYNNHKFTEALEAYTLAVALTPSEDTWYWISQCQYNLENYQAMLDNIDKALTINPIFAKGFFNKAIAYHSLKEYDKALAFYDKALSLEPEGADVWILPSIWLNKGIIFCTGKEIPKSIDAFAEAIKLDVNYKSMIIDYTKQGIQNNTEVNKEEAEKWLSLWNNEKFQAIIK